MIVGRSKRAMPLHCDSYTYMGEEAQRAEHLGCAVAVLEITN